MCLSMLSCFFTVECWKQISLMILTYTAWHLIHPSSNGGVMMILRHLVVIYQTVHLSCMTRCSLIWSRQIRPTMCLHDWIVWWYFAWRIKCSVCLLLWFVVFRCFLQNHNRKIDTDQRTDRSSNRDLRMHLVSLLWNLCGRKYRHRERRGLWGLRIDVQRNPAIRQPPIRKIRL